MDNDYLNELENLESGVSAFAANKDKLKEIKDNRKKHKEKQAEDNIPSDSDINESKEI